MRPSLSPHLLAALLVFACTPARDRPARRPPTPAAKEGLTATGADPFTGLLVSDDHLPWVFRHGVGPKPPAAGFERMEKFPEPPAPPRPEPAQPPRVLRVQPTGEIQDTKAISIAFSQPMVPLASVEDTRAVAVPATLEPALPGRWRWLGTHLLTFEPDRRLPGSTHFKVTIPQGFRSALGTDLAETAEFTFSTPPMRVLDFYPDYDALPQSPIVVTFDQDIDPAAVEPFVHLELIRDEGDPRPVRVRPMTRAQFEAHPHVKKHELSWQEKRTLALLPDRPLLLDREYRIVVLEGAPSAEGPRRTARPQDTHFTTLGPMRVTRLTCTGRSRKPCRPNYDWTFEFSNATELEEEDFQKFVRVTPAVKNLHADLYGNNGSIYGEFQPDTTYTVTILAGIEDHFKQKLAASHTVTIRVGDAWPDLQLPDLNSGVLEHTTRKLDVPVVNLSQPSTLRLFRVPPRRIFQAMSARYHFTWDRDHHPANGLGKPDAEWKATLSRRRNTPEMYPLDLDRALGGKNGAVFIEIDAPSLKTDPEDATIRKAFVQVSSIGITATHDPERLHVLTTGLSDARPRKDTPVRLYLRPVKDSDEAPLVWEGRTGADGAAWIPWPAALQSQKRDFAIVAGGDDDLAFLIVRRELRHHGQSASVDRQVVSPSMPVTVRDLVFTDRDPYRPGDTVELAGWIRLETEGPSGRLEALPMIPGAKSFIEWELHDPLNERVAKGNAPLDGDGAFHATWTAPRDATLGIYRFSGVIHGAATSQPPVITGRFSVLAFRPPEHVVEVKIPQDTVAFGDRFLARIEGRYTFGAAMRGATVRYTARLAAAYFRPPGNPDFTFNDGYHPSWWRSSRILYQGESTLDGTGAFTVTEKLPEAGGAATDGPATITLEASVEDVNRQSISARGSKLVHPASFYAGVRLPRTVARAGEALDVSALVVDVDGRLIGGRKVRLRALREVQRKRPAQEGDDGDPGWETVLEEKSACELTSADRAMSCRLTFPEAGYHWVEAVTLDERGRSARARAGLWVLGLDETAWTTGDRTRLRLTLDRAEYRPGEKAKLVIEAPYHPATGVLTLNREGILSTRVIQVKSAVHVEELAIEEGHVPNLWATVTLLRGRVKTAAGVDPDTGRPHMVTQSLLVPVSLESKRLRIEARSVRGLVEPGGKVELELRSADPTGAPVAARLAVVLVDEGVLSLLGYALPDPLAFFFPRRREIAWRKDLRPDVLGLIRYERPQRDTPDLEPPEEDIDGVTRAYGSGGSGGYSAMGVSIRLGAGPARPMNRARHQRASESGASPGAGLDAVALRGRFATTAYYNDRVLTGADGLARLSFTMPENLTTYRVMVLAMDPKAPDRFGSAEDRVTIRKDFMLRAALPRFANHQDTFEAGVVLTSLLDREGPAEVKIGGTGFTLLDPDVRTVQLSSRRSEEVRFRVRTDRPGTASFTFAARHLGLTDGVAAPPIPVHVPATTEHTAVYGMTDKAVLQPVVPPGRVFPQFGGLDVHVSSTGLSGLQDAARFLFENEWECSEATASRLVPIFALRDILPKFGLGAASDPDRLDALARSGIKDLLAHQAPDGGFRLWPGSRVWPYPSIYVTWALLRGREAGFEVPDASLRRAAGYLARLARGEERLHSWWYYSYSTEIYAAWVLTEMARLKILTEQDLKREQVPRQLTRLFGERKKVGYLARLWLLHALWRVEGDTEGVRVLRRELENSVVETAAGAHFSETMTDGLAALMHSEARTDAVALRVLLDLDPKHILLPKIVRGLMSSRVRGAWGSSQGNAFVLDALAAYFRVVEAQEPDFTMNVWYDRLFAGTRRFRGRSMDIVHARIPMKTLLEQGAGGVLLTKDGPGRLYYRLGLAYVPADPDLPPESQGLTVSRTYESMDDDPKAVELVSPGRWRIRAGATVLVRLTLTAPDRRDFVALSDPLPAGLEGIDTRLDTAPRMTRRGDTGVRRGWWWHGPVHQELRDDRFVAYYDSLDGGTWHYAYMARATTLGTFTAPPVRAMEMYHPEVFGRGPREQVEVVP
jgi:alpha-2-macroglobulin